MEGSLKWSAKLQPFVADKRLQGDKIILPQSALEALLAAAPVVSIENHRTARQTSDFDPFNPYSFAAERRAREALSDHQPQLPHPLTFRLVNPDNGRVVYAGIREFSAEEGSVGLSDFLLVALGYRQHTESHSHGRNGVSSDGAMVLDDSDSKAAVGSVTIHAHQLPKGTYVRLRPLEAGYDPEDWKSLLERYLRDTFTTLTNGEILVVPGARHEDFKFLVDKFEPEGDGICIVDTDLEVDIEALNEEQAKETLSRRLARAKQIPDSATGNSTGGSVNVNQQVNGRVLPGAYVDYELKIWDRTKDLNISVQGDESSVLDLLVSPFSARQRQRPRLDEHVFADLSSRPNKRLKISHSNVAVGEADSIFISIHTNDLFSGESVGPFSYDLTISNGAIGEDDSDNPAAPLGEPGPDEVICKNCHQIIPKRTLPLHEAFCYRNNIACPECQTVFLKNSDAWKSHWHCPHDDDFGSGEKTRAKHDQYYHPQKPLRCTACEYEAYDLPVLANHRTTACAEKEILCQFCHLVVPQKGPEDPDFADAEVLLSGLTPHEVTDGGRTTECHLCKKIVKLQNMSTHMMLHDRDRVLRPRPKLCINAICGRVIKAGREYTVEKDQLGLCDECFGPLHGTAYDPEGKALRRRVERRLLQQLMGGCGKSWCHNHEWCRTGRKNTTGQDMVVTAKDALPIVKPVLDQLVQRDFSHLRFCTDEASQSRKTMAEMVAAEGIYELEWCIKALEESKNDLARARDWLKDMAPKKDEVVS